MGNVELFKKLEQLKAIQDERKILEAQEAALKDEVKAEMLSRGVDEVRIGIRCAKWLRYTKKVFNTDLFKADHEDLYEEYRVPSQVSQLRVR